MSKADKTPIPDNITPLPKVKKQKRLFKKKRAGVVLTENEVIEIKKGRKKLRKELRANGIKSKKDFELTASSLGLYFDKRKFFPLLLLLLRGKALWALLGALAALLTAFFIMSLVTKMRGHFTINMTDDMFREGFSLSSVESFENPTGYLYSQPLEGAPCISIMDIPENVGEVDGFHDDLTCFVYTFYIKNEGITTVGYDYQLLINSESQDLSRATWIMLFEDGEMSFYAQARDDGTAEALPAFDDNTRGYRRRPFFLEAKDPDAQYQKMEVNSSLDYYRIIPHQFISDTTVMTGRMSGVAPEEVHKYTVVIWLEGDDPDCTNELIGGHLGLELNFKLISESEYHDSTHN